MGCAIIFEGESSVNYENKTRNVNNFIFILLAMADAGLRLKFRACRKPENGTIAKQDFH